MCEPLTDPMTLFIIDTKWLYTCICYSSERDRQVPQVWWTVCPTRPKVRHNYILGRVGNLNGPFLFPVSHQEPLEEGRVKPHSLLLCLWASGLCSGPTTRAFRRQLSFALSYFMHLLIITLFNKGIPVIAQVACIFLNNLLNLIDWLD